MSTDHRTPTHALTFGSLFAGIGGLDLGFERAGWSCAWQVEIDDFCQEILAKHWPDVPRFDDVRAVGAAQLARVDLVVGGFPCQDLSVAGKRRGLKGERSGLWREFARLIDEVRPRYVVVENVLRGWRSWVPVVRGDLWRLGYASLPLSLRASDFGAPHERPRCFIVADALGEHVRLQSWRRGGESRPGSSLAAIDGETRRAPDADNQGQLQPSGRVGEVGRGPSDCAWWATEPDVARVVHGVPAGVDRTRASRERALGNAVCPPIAEWIGRRLLEAA